ncbi:MAG: transcriptional repressor [Candidatus Nanopelagicales bacterium]|jgi:Fur family ferric uptake transcriptional regulator|nr:transcriptional repressor [Candidatus Nanopelagicales bacterium]
MADARSLDAAERLRAAGLRSTGQRRAVLEALTRLGHADVDELAAAVQVAVPDVSLSTVYRALEALESVGLATHTHLHHGAPTYHSVDDEPHLHLVCAACGAVASESLAVALDLASAVRAASGFEVDLTHLALHGRCAGCARVDAVPDPDRAPEAPPEGPGSSTGSLQTATTLTDA